MPSIKKIKFLVSLVILPLILTGCFKANQTAEQTMVPNQAESDNMANLPTSRSKTNDQSVIKNADQLMEPPTILDNLSDQDLLTLEQTDNAAYLNRVQRVCAEPDSTECLDRVQLQQVFILDNPDLCSQLSGQQDKCYENFAYSRNDLKYCDLIQNQAAKSGCVDLVSHVSALNNDNIALCDNINSETRKSDCRSGVMTNHNDLSYCDLSYIQNNNLVDECYSIIFSNQARQSNNSALCDQVPLDNYKLSCFSELP
ncbi:MAG: hypothetical protein UV78_C0019G0007 [Parcubacteria group bacterium GW2011_GWA2_43_17]|nr:MAG: hypothetical protein UV78_C0019G0007 [Parcubacteria group bacterium GW2011_GWA2_43_17]KKT92203.1 MAG: hypothetical protein UW91_C0025G0017 [Parcubacteria group bacterium GW2011_GWF2_45_11]KKT98831.1 MAG: hypothetical protein UW98_C0001G0007 [Parcubacteria group bacterium GW2011_GWC2_45_15]OGY94084.1 MAG: hypothetical protein A2260_00995 [Candidatus Komeilibacteria bacterium RIFOXYA2_FULL_45_9]OGY96134.1 MAG: hypothetical protein A3J95_03530 [Candidatus Komeilibacteria bacterium RIFOXYC2